MKTQSDYQILWAGKFEDLSNLVNKKLGEGYITVGGVCFSSGYLIQAVVKESEQPKISHTGPR